MTDFELTTDALQRLVLNRPGHDDVADVRVRRAFPWSSPDHFISICSSDGKELLLIDDRSTLTPAQRSAIDEALGSSVFIPRITRVEEVDVRFGYQQWKVHTDRGSAEFRVQEREDIRFLPDGRFAVRDADGNVYELESLSSLDDHSRKALEPIV
jgi:hypothetical protein